MYTMAMNSKNFDPYLVEKIDINGIPVYYKELSWAPCVHIEMAFDVGAFNDPVGQEGIAHFLEHLVGNGSPKLPDKKAVEEFNRMYMLKSHNAYTSQYMTSYVGKCLPENFELVTEAMLDLTFNPFLRPEDTEHERKVITQEAWQRYKNEKYLNYVKRISSIIFPKHQGSRISSALGWPETITTITNENLKDFHKKKYVKENFSVFIVGALNREMLKTLESLLKNTPSGDKSTVDYGFMDKPAENRVVVHSDEIGDPTEQLEYTIERFLPKVEKNTRVASQTRALLYDILFERLRTDLSLCYGVRVGIYSTKDYSSGSIGVQTSEDKLELVETEIWKIIKEITDGKWEERFNIIHKTHIEQIRARERTSDMILGYTVREQMYNNKITTLENTLKEEENVTYKDVCELIEKFFVADQVFTEIILPAKK